VTKWFLEFFLAMQCKEQEQNNGEEKWSFGLIAEVTVTERSVLKRMREAVEEKVRLLWGIFASSANSPSLHGLMN
jgi:replication fork protection complex subunit Tof1/Swi1